MQVLRVNEKKAEYSINGENFKSVKDIDRDDLFTILDIAYEQGSVEYDNSCDEILNDAEKTIYGQLIIQLSQFLQNAPAMKMEIDNLFEESLKKYTKQENESTEK
jgi:hypothetical protein